MENADIDLDLALLPTLERKADRLLVNGWSTGVEVSHAMAPGRQFPAISVVTLAIRRFLRAVCCQDLSPESAA
jgi:2,5-dioxopentanoate dehydrogenase